MNTITVTYNGTPVTFTRTGRDWWEQTSDYTRNGHTYGERTAWRAPGLGPVVVACSPVLANIVRRTIRDMELRAYRAAEFFTEARAFHDDVAQGAYPTLSATPNVLAPYYVLGFCEFRHARIIGQITRDAYLVEFAHNGAQRGVFSHELVIR